MECSVELAMRIFWLLVNFRWQMQALKKIAAAKYYVLMNIQIWKGIFVIIGIDFCLECFVCMIS